MSKSPKPQGTGFTGFPANLTQDDRTKGGMKTFTAAQRMPIAFTKVDLPHGWLGNMAPFPVRHDGKWWRTTEALFQALRFHNEAIKEEIRALPSPMGAKMRAKRHKAKRVIEPQSEQDVANMEMVLRLKLEQHPELKQRLIDTGAGDIIEDSTRRPGGSGKYWGAAFKDGQWVGRNMVGKLWMKLREELGSKPHKAIVPRKP